MIVGTGCSSCNTIVINNGVLYERFKAHAVEHMGFADGQSGGSYPDRSISHYYE